MIEVSNLTKKYGGFTAVKDLSFTLEPGDILGFLGPNGAGKSTTMKMLTGFLRPSSGRAVVKGFDVAEDSQQAQRFIGYLPEGAPAYEEMTVTAFLQFIAQARGVAPEIVSTAVAGAIGTMSLKPVAQQKIETLSKGYKRRVGLAQAILHDPDILILDEPTDGLDPNQKHQVREMIKNLSKDKIVIISTHILEEVTAVCSRVMILAGGCIAVDTSPTELLARSRYHGAVTLELSETDLDQVKAQLSSVIGVASVELIENALTVFPVDGESQLFERVLEFAREQDWTLTSIHSEQGRLDDVFRELTGGDVA